MESVILFKFYVILTEGSNTGQKMKFYNKNFASKCGQTAVSAVSIGLGYIYWRNL